MSALNKFWVGAVVQFHNYLYRYRAGRGMGTASIKAKFLQQLATMREKVFYKVFLDLKKAYDAKDRESSLNMLVAYGVRPRKRTPSTSVMGKTHHISIGGAILRHPVHRVLGVTQGNPLSPTIFNMMVDVGI